MIFKVFYQQDHEVPPIRERTKSLFIEAETVREVRRKLADRNYNIEFVQEVDDAFLEFEKQSDQFEVER
ncbi:MAG TPA: RNA polymerase epsilon subunit [Bacillales bacterium]|jgi:DNA-dependent RNA polymerase auxiliary subunit epsilon|nr:RNA polymerase epsilon subunit [Bacillales bacterium]